MQENGNKQLKIKLFDQKDLELLFMDLDEITRIIQQLPPEEKLILSKQLLGESQGITVVFNGNGNGNSNVIQNSVVVQTSGSQEISEQLTEKIKNISPEVLDDLLIAIAMQIKSRSEPSEVAP